MNKEATNNEILEAINDFSTKVDERFSGIENDISGIKGEIVGIKNTMVTKDYLDEKIADLRGDLVVLLRKEDNKLGALITELLDRKVIDDAAARRILTMEPFTQTS